MSALWRTRLFAFCALVLSLQLAQAEKPFEKLKEKVRGKRVVPPVVVPPVVIPPVVVPPGVPPVVVPPVVVPPLGIPPLVGMPRLAPYKISDPVVCENLTIFFLMGENQLAARTILTLDEALAQKKVIVHETNTVNVLTVENTSDVEVFVQAGDIVKGGQQDRTIAVDVLLSARSGRVSINSFCVEKGRWSARGTEDVTRFSRSYGVIIGNSLKIAARSTRNQNSVWKEINDAQNRLALVLKVPVQDPTSVTSLQLTLENRSVQEAIGKYLEKLHGALPDKDAGNVIGYAMAINGRVISADVYANSDLFRRLWPKLLRASVTEAVSERKEGMVVRPVRKEAVGLFLAASALGKLTERTVLGSLKEVQRETLTQIQFETRIDKDGIILRRSYLAK